MICKECHYIYQKGNSHGKQYIFYIAYVCMSVVYAFLLGGTLVASNARMHIKNDTGEDLEVKIVRTGRNSDYEPEIILLAQGKKKDKNKSAEYNKYVYEYEYDGELPNAENIPNVGLDTIWIRKVSDPVLADGRKTGYEVPCNMWPFASMRINFSGTIIFNNGNGAKKTYCGLFSNNTRFNLANAESNG